ncbi:hypothetical protein [Streptomyces sp. AC627_RSS907]|uniref:hypothetical protein n=1 Tax=Streptomyces sp. AC627_RSS907 TaxID=2823684 RepID=UPI001C2203DF|nr:hypothetical protein [Streptomyces sp. AC627_RSS907]
MDCEQACPALAARLFGSLEEPERTAVDDHMRGCAFCREQYEQLGEVLPLLDLVAMYAPSDPEPRVPADTECSRASESGPVPTAGTCSPGHITVARRGVRPGRPHR